MAQELMKRPRRNSLAFRHTGERPPAVSSSQALQPGFINYCASPPGPRRSPSENAQVNGSDQLCGPAPCPDSWGWRWHPRPASRTPSRRLPRRPATRRRRPPRQVGPRRPTAAQMTTTPRVQTHSRRPSQPLRATMPTTLVIHPRSRSAVLRLIDAERAGRQVRRRRIS